MTNRPSTAVPIWAMYYCPVCGKYGDGRVVLPGEHLEWHKQRGEGTHA